MISVVLLSPLGKPLNSMVADRSCLTSIKALVDELVLAGAPPAAVSAVRLDHVRGRCDASVTWAWVNPDAVNQIEAALTEGFLRVLGATR